MKKVKKLLLILLTAVCMVWGMSCLVYGDTIDGNTNMDVVLAIDVSGSMKTTDPNKIALEGAKLFIDMMESTGSRAGIVAFSDELVQVYNLTSINSDADKNSLKTIIDNLNFVGDTDIGSAIQKSVEILSTAQDIGNKKMILFFTDGEIDLPKGVPSEAEAEANSRTAAENAVSTASSSGIPIYTIGLNVNGGVDTDLISKMSSETGAKTSTVANADELPSIFNDIFADFVETEINELGDIEISNADEYEELSFEIPNDSVLEANIVMITNGQGVLNDILLVKPNGDTIGPDGQTLILSTSNNYNMLKMIGPPSGTWKLRIKGDQGCKVHVNLLFNYNVILKLSGQEDSEGNLDMIATLEKNGQTVTDTALYDQLVTVVNVTREDGTTTTYPMTLSGNSFVCNVPVAKGEKIKAYAHTEGANMYRDSDTIEYQNGKVDPIVQKNDLPSPIELKGIVTSLTKKKINLDDYFDVSDSSNAIVQYTAQTDDDTISSSEVDGTELILRGGSKGSTMVYVQAADSQGNTLTQQAEVIVSGIFSSLLPLILIVAGFLLILLIVILIIILMPKPMVGYLFWQIVSEDGYAMNTNEEQYDLTFAGTKVLVSNFVTEIELSYSGLDRIEIKAVKSGIKVQNKGKACILLNENNAEVKKMTVYDGGVFRIACQTEDGENELVAIRYQRDINEMMF